MTFTPLCPEGIAPVNLTPDYDGASVYGQLRVGDMAIYQRQLLRTGYLPYSAIDHAFLRCEEFTAKMCCGTYPMDQFHLVLVDSTGKEHQLHLEKQEDGQPILDRIAQLQPRAKIGFYKNQQ